MTPETQPLIGAVAEDFQVYLDRIGYVNASSLKALDISPLHYLHALTVKSEDTPTRLLGSVVHCLFEESQYDFDKRFFVTPKIDMRTTKGKSDYAEFLIESKGRKLISQEVMDKSKIMFENAMKNKSLREFINDSDRERSFHWIDKDTGLPCKMRPDLVRRSGSVIGDLKTCGDVSPSGFARTCADFKYDIQTGFYLNGASVVNEKTYEEFIFVALENVPPYDCVLYRCTNEFKELAKFHVWMLMDKLKKCIDENKWEGVSHITDEEHGLVELDLPVWYSRNINFQLI